MSALVVAGVAVLLLGAVVLLRFPDRPGGRIAWQGLEVSSIGAGLPLVVVGLLAITLGSGIGRGDGELAGRAPALSVGGRGGGAAACERALAGVDPARVATVEVGARDLVVVRSDQPKGKLFALALSDGGAAIAAVRAAYLPASDLFLLEAVVGAGCEPIAPTNLTFPGADPVRPPNFSDLRLAVGSSDVVLALKGGSDVRVDLARYVP